MKSKLAYFFSEDFAPYLFVLPVIIFLLLMTVFPLIYSLVLSFNEWNLAFGTPRHFVGGQNYLRLFNDARFWNGMLNTGYKVLIGVGLQFLLGLGLALLFNREFPGKGFLVSVFILPSILAPIVAGTTFRMIFNYDYGPLNFILNKIGLGTFNWLGSSALALPSIIAVDSWQWTPFMMLVLLAGLQSIPVEYYEAARVDGASGFQTFFRITLPLLRRSIAIALIIRIMDAVKLFDLVYVLTNGGPGNSSETIPFYTYLSGFKHFRIGYTAAMSYIQLVFIIIMAQLFLRIWKQGEA